ncbi:hypothetical protein KKB28_02260 [bacterium]|nr:hypothetical protein [bacterium]
MFTKRAFLAVVLIAIMATMSYGQAVWLYNDSGNPAGYFSAAANRDGWAAKFFPATARFAPDSVIVFMYNHGTGSTQLARVVIYEDDGIVGGGDCTPAETCDGPGTLIYTGSDVTLSMPSGYGWVGISLASCDDTLDGNFIILLELRAAQGLSLLTDDINGVDCCVNFMRYLNVWYEHWSFWSGADQVGNNMIRVHGEQLGAGNPPTLQITPGAIFYGNALINWLDGNPEPITFEDVSLKNIGTGIDTVTAITSSNPDFYWTGNALPFYIASGVEEFIDVTFETSTEGDRFGDLVVTHTGLSATTDTVYLSGIGWTGHWLENFYQVPDTLVGSWWIQRDSTLDNQTWAYYQGGYASMDGTMGHQYSLPDSFVIDWIYCDPLSNPGVGAKVTWMNKNQWNADYYYHAFYWTAPDCSYFYFVDEIPPTTSGDYVEEGPHYINSVSDSIVLAYLYAGAFADVWMLDDIKVDSLPQLPPTIEHEHHCDVTDDFVHITARVMDPNSDAMTVTLYYKAEQDIAWSSTAMAAVVGCEYNDLYEATIADLTSCCRYNYYFAATDPAGSGLTTYLPATAPTDYYNVDIMNAPTEIVYDSGGDWYVTYYYSWWARWAVRFTPPSYPYYLGGAHFKAPDNWPDDDHQDMVFEVYDDNGAANLPGTLLYGPDETGMCWNLGADACDDTSFNSWYYVKFCPCIEITDGDFYIAMRNLDGADEVYEGVAYDDDGPSGTAYPAYRTYIFTPDETPGSGSWGIDTAHFNNDPLLPHSDLILRAVECGLVDPSDLTVLEDGTGNVELNWDGTVACCFDVYRAADMADPAWPGDFSLIASCVMPPYQDVLTTEAKAMYVVAGACDPTTAPPMMTIPIDIGPVRYEDYNKVVDHRLGEPWTPTEGVWPVKISKEKLQKGMKLQSAKTSWNTAK